MFKNYLYLLFIVLLGYSNSVFAQSKIQEALSTKGKTHSADIYHLLESKGDNKAEINLFAYEYSEYNVPNKLLGIKVELHLELPIPGSTAKVGTDYYAFIDEDEFPEVIVALNNLIEDYNRRIKKELLGSISYITKDNICLGYIITHEKKQAFIEINEKGNKVKATFPNPDKFFQGLNSQIDLASKKLYLPENAEKLKNVKKTKQEDNSNEVIIDDI